MNFCYNCGAKLISDANFCGNCGIKLPNTLNQENENTLDSSDTTKLIYTQQHFSSSRVKSNQSTQKIGTFLPIFHLRNTAIIANIIMWYVLYVTAGIIESDTDDFSVKPRVALYFVISGIGLLILLILQYYTRNKLIWLTGIWALILLYFPYDSFLRFFGLYQWSGLAIAQYFAYFPEYSNPVVNILIGFFLINLFFYRRLCNCIN
ncbi:hypothetical protein DF281_00060 [Kurthia zopfii]|uniref:Predicted membrane protein n=1 Tax=Kurthia zopfii TaxID=1650 RepID=A0A8B4QBY9_9BACL|nr:zinc ribbon domain-containing protein [Kurthia zopfii]PWI23924.1 hypothetical protein DF281_00060 [Kurthia zopfii]TDR44175.1 hypothetical protein DFR61_10111 [Kurthia zopfii]STX10219.1 Predicted membrane protein [Kurthia zopfii]